MTSRIFSQKRLPPLPFGQELVFGDGAGVVNKRRKTTEPLVCAKPSDNGSSGSLERTKDGQKDQDAAETLVSLLLHRTSEERNNNNKKRKRASAATVARVSGWAQSQDRVDTDSENEVTTTHPDTTPPEAQRDGSPQTLQGKADDELVGTPRLPRAVRVTSRTHLVLHQLYLHKRFGSQCRDGGSPVASSSSSSTICANGSALPSMASRVVHMTSSPQALATCSSPAVTGSALRSPAAPESQTNVVAPIPQLLAFTERQPSSSLPLSRYVSLGGMIPSLTVPSVVEPVRAPTDPRLVPIRPRPSPF